MRAFKRVEVLFRFAFPGRSGVRSAKAGAWMEPSISINGGAFNSFEHPLSITLSCITHCLTA